jgi:hypothetical protein
MSSAEASACPRQRGHLECRTVHERGRAQAGDFAGRLVSVEFGRDEAVFARLDRSSGRHRPFDNRPNFTVADFEALYPARSLRAAALIGIESGQMVVIDQNRTGGGVEAFHQGVGIGQAELAPVDGRQLRAFRENLDQRRSLAVCGARQHGRRGQKKAERCRAGKMSLKGCCNSVRHGRTLHQPVALSGGDSRHHGAGRKPHPSITISILNHRLSKPSGTPIAVRMGKCAGQALKAVSRSSVAVAFFTASFKCVDGRPLGADDGQSAGDSLLCDINLRATLVSTMWRGSYPDEAGTSCRQCAMQGAQTFSRSAMMKPAFCLSSPRRFRNGILCRSAVRSIPCDHPGGL